MLLRDWDIRNQPNFQSKILKHRACNPNMLFDAFQMYVTNRNQTSSCLRLTVVLGPSSFSVMVAVLAGGCHVLIAEIRPIGGLPTLFGQVAQRGSGTSNWAQAPRHSLGITLGSFW